MITFTQNQSRGQLYAECSETGQDYRIPTSSVEDFLADADLTLEQALKGTHERTQEMHSALASTTVNVHRPQRYGGLLATYRN